MNRKGFTLIELLAVIILLGIVLVFTVPNILDTYKNSKLKTEKVFVDKLSDVIDGHIKLNSYEIEFNEEVDGKKCLEHTYEDDKEICTTDKTYTVKINKGEILVSKIIEGKLISESDYINAGNKDVKCNINAKIEVYKDSDYVYCHKVQASELACLTEEYIKSICPDENQTCYAIDTCVWEEAK